MQTNFNRLIYDPCFVNKDLQQQQGVHGYIMDKTKYQLPPQLQTRHNVVGILQNNPVGTLDKQHPSLIDAENDLIGLTRTRTNCPGAKYNPNKQCPNGNQHCLHRGQGNCSSPGCIKHIDSHVNKSAKRPIIQYHQKVGYKTCSGDKCF